MDPHRNCRSVPRVLSVLLLAVPPLLAGPPKPATDDEVKAMIAAAGDAKDFARADIVYVLDEADVYVQPSGLATTEACQVIKVLTDAGAKAQAVHRTEFDPATNRIAVDSVRIHRKDKTVEEVPLDGLVVQPAKQWMIYWGNQQHMLSLPRVEVGDSIEIRTSKVGYNIAYLGDAGGAGVVATAATRSGGLTSNGGVDATGLVPPMEGHWYEVTLFQGSYPILNKRYSVHMPKDMPVQFGVYNGALQSSLWYADDHHVSTWSAENLPAIKREPHMVAFDDVAIKLVMATVPDWEMKSRWFHVVNDGQFDADEAIRSKVEELTAHLTDEEAKIAACNNWVADNIRYYGTSRGPCEGFTLHKSTETFRDRGGVCKDKAGMLVTMLRVLGHDAYPALTMAGSRVEAIPADQFNHTVTAIRNKDGSFRVLDPTWAPMSREAWSSREARQALVYGTPEGQTLTLSPYFAPDYNLLEVKGNSRIGEEGTLTTDLAFNLKGYPCTYLRRSIGGQPRPEQRAVLEGAINIAPNARLEKIDVIDPYDYSKDAYARFTVSAEHYAGGGDSVHLFKLPLMTHPLAEFLTPDLLYPVDAEKREYGMRLRATRLVRYEDRIKLPDGWSVTALPKAQEIDTPIATLAFSAKANDGVLSYTFELSVKEHIVPAKDYPDYRRVIKAMQAIADDWVVCESGQGRSELARQGDIETEQGGSR